MALADYTQLISSRDNFLVPQHQSATAKAGGTFRRCVRGPSLSLYSRVAPWLRANVGGSESGGGSGMWAHADLRTASILAGSGGGCGASASGAAVGAAGQQGWGQMRTESVRATMPVRMIPPWVMQERQSSERSLGQGGQTSVDGMSRTNLPQSGFVAGANVALNDAQMQPLPKQAQEGGKASALGAVFDGFSEPSDAHQIAACPAHVAVNSAPQASTASASGGDTAVCKSSLAAAKHSNPDLQQPRFSEEVSGPPVQRASTYENSFNSTLDIPQYPSSIHVSTKAEDDDGGGDGTARYGNMGGVKSKMPVSSLLSMGHSFFIDYRPETFKILFRGLRLKVGPAGQSTD